MAAQQRIVIGECYCDVQTKGFKSVVWIVVGVSTQPDGIEHVRLVSAHDDTVSKTLSLAVLLDPRRFRRIDYRPPGTPTSA